VGEEAALNHRLSSPACLCQKFERVGAEMVGGAGVHRGGCACLCVQNRRGVFYLCVCMCVCVYACVTKHEHTYFCVHVVLM
jgi:hypothetical protein